MGSAAYRGKGSKGRAVVSGERPIGAVSCRQVPPPPPTHPPTLRAPQPQQ